jgi:hypothetical protein
VVALVGLRDQLVDLAGRNLRQNAVAFADGQQDRVQHLVDALNHLAMNAVEQGCLAALGEAALLGCVHQAHDLLQHQHRVFVFGPDAAWRRMRAARARTSRVRFRRVRCRRHAPSGLHLPLLSP